MPNVSDIALIGHIGRDAEIKQTKRGPVCEFSLAVTPWSKEEPTTSWYRCSWFGDRAVNLAPNLGKGKAVYVRGELRPREFNGKNDELRTSLDVRVTSIELLGGGAGDGASGVSRAKANPSPAPAPADDDDLPF